MIVGFKVAEETYDQLSLRDQIILDLIAAGWGQNDICLLFKVTQPAISACMRRIRYKLAESTMRTVIEVRNLHRAESRVQRVKMEPKYIPDND
jgi:DNA-binding NarL/FixJ family response regulator